MKSGNSISTSMMWKVLERYSVLGAQLIVQIVIARIISPAEYGLVSMMTVFISIATVFIQNGFNMALVQKKDSNEVDFSTAFFINLAIGVCMYCILFIAAPYIAEYYAEPLIKECLRVLGLILIIGSVNAIQNAIAAKNMDFKMLFIANISGSIIAGAVGIWCAFLGFGVWALIVQQLLNKSIVTIVLLFLLKWKPKLVVDKKSASSMFKYGWKLLAAGLINQIYNELNSLIIGKKYTSTDLAYYTKGKQFPNYITTGIDSSVQTVMFSAFSKTQSDIKVLCGILRKSVCVNTYIVFPLMMGLSAVADTFVQVILTEKWIGIVPFMRICCVMYAFHPIESTHLQAIAAVGRSDVRLKLEFIKKPIGIVLLILASPYGPFAIAVSAVLTSLISLLVDVTASTFIVKLSVKEQLRDIIPTIIITCVMGCIVYMVGLLSVNIYLKLVVQVLVGVVIYLILSIIFRLEGLSYVRKMINEKIGIRI